MDQIYEMVIGLEVHVELKTKTKIFCGCSTSFGAEQNTQCCPVCMGMPGTLPVLNRQVVRHAVKAGLATNCRITRYGKQDRKNYFYPDLPKAYQISQYDLPLCTGGYLDIEGENGAQRIGITRTLRRMRVSWCIRRTAPALIITAAASRWWRSCLSRTSAQPPRRLPFCKN
mgnify:CR=1 FL=1